MKNPHGFIYVTVSSSEEARKTASALVQQKLVACANIFPSVVSCYEWKGKYTEEKETVLILKTREDLFEQARKAILKYSSYECPCIVFIPFSKGHPSFFSYLDAQLSQTGLGAGRTCPDEGSAL